MSLAAFLPLMSTAVVVKAFSTQSAFGSPSYATAASTYPARVVAKPTQVFDAGGEEVVARHVAWVGTTSTIGAQDSFSWGGSTYRIVAVERPTDQTGIHHNKVFLG